MTNSEHNDLDKLLKDNLSDKAANVPAFVWDNIEAELFPKKKRRGFFWLFFFGTLLIAGISTIGLVGFGRTRISEHPSHELTTNNSPHHLKTEKATGSQTRFTSSSSPKGEQSEPVAGSVESTETTTVSGTTTSVSSRETGRQRYSNSSNLHTARSGGGTTCSQSEQHQPTNTRNLSVVPGIVSENNGNSASDPATDDQSRSDSVSHSESVDSLATLHIMPIANGLANYLFYRKKEEQPPRFLLLAYGGPSFYSMALFKDYFTSGALSNHSSASYGVEAGLGLQVRIGSRFGVYSAFAFNRKQTGFQYDVAITEDDYFEYIDVEEQPMPDPNATIPFENISDNGTNSCFVVRDFTTRYAVNSWQFSIGGTVQLVRWRKFSLGADLRFGVNISSQLKMQEWTDFSMPSHEKERFRAFRPGGGLWLYYQLTRRIALGLTPMYSWQFQRGRSPFIAGMTKELIVPVGVKIGL